MVTIGEVHVPDGQLMAIFDKETKQKGNVSYFTMHGIGTICGGLKSRVFIPWLSSSNQPPHILCD